MRLVPEAHWTLTDLFLARVKASPDGKAYRWFDGNQWVDMNWSQAAAAVGRWRAALVKEKLQPGDRVGLCARNRIEWMCFDQAALSLGLVVVPLFYNDRPDNMAYCLDDAGAKLAAARGRRAVAGDSPPCAARSSASCASTTRPATIQRALSVHDWLPAQGVKVEREPGQGR
ncbi:MAG: AMP-binding protein [Chromatiales bacterium]|nr:AMP-binding protein [Chromatiales bacterium]